MVKLDDVCHKNAKNMHKFHINRLAPMLDEVPVKVQTFSATMCVLYAFLYEQPKEILNQAENFAQSSKTRMWNVCIFVHRLSSLLFRQVNLRKNIIPLHFIFKLLLL